MNGDQASYERMIGAFVFAPKGNDQRFMDKPLMKPSVQLRVGAAGALLAMTGAKLPSPRARAISEGLKQRV
eukprot:11174418-Lingulodinium_polyedra.AAC.1